MMVKFTKPFLITAISVSLIFISACGTGNNQSSSASSGGNEDSTAPIISSTSPVDNANDVAQSSTITANFNEDILNTSVDAASFILTKPNGGNASGNVSFDGANNIASFTPDSPLSKLTAYTATLSTNITDLNGNALASNYSWSFTTAGGGWGSAEQIDTGEHQAISPQITFDDDYNAIAVWRQKRNIYANYFDGSRWLGTELIETNDDEGNADTPQVAFDNNGNAVVVWSQNTINNRGYNIWANRFNGSSWSGAELVEFDDGNSIQPHGANSPQIAFNSSGQPVVVWGQKVIGNNIDFNSILTSHFNGTNWGTAERIDSAEAFAYLSQIITDRNGDLLAVWEQSSSIWVNRFDGSSWGSAQSINASNTTIFRLDPKIAIDSNSNALVVWSQFDSTKDKIFVSHFDGTNWGEPELFEMGSTEDRAHKPQIAFDDDNVIVVWSQRDSNFRRNIWSNRFDGTNWTGPELIESKDDGHASDPQIAFDNNGNALAAWSQYDNNSNRARIWVNRFNNNSWGNPEPIETSEFDAEAPQITVSNDGNAFVIWTQSDGSGSTDIFTSRFE